jgi:DNA-binding CsgD family transcriptional regulator
VKIQRELAHFRRLACLGLPPQAATAALLEALHNLIPSSFNRLGFCDDQLRITNGYSEHPEVYRSFGYYFSEIDGKVDYWPTVQDCLRRGPGVGYYLPFQTARYYRSDYYHEIERPLGSHHQLDATIGNQHRVFGNLILSRHRGAEFQPEELALLGQLLPYFTHALGAPPTTDVSEMASTADHAVAVVDNGGALQYADAAGLRYLWMIHHDDLVHSDIVTKAMAQSNQLQPLVARLIAIEVQRPASPPSVTVHNGWGRFVLRAERLFNPRGEPGHVRVIIEYAEPSVLARCRRLHELDLSPRLRDICEFLIQGQSQQEIALSLGIRPSTVNEYLQALYSKFNVHSRQALLQMLSQAPSP